MQVSEAFSHWTQALMVPMVFFSFLFVQITLKIHEEHDVKQWNKRLRIK